MPARPPAPTAMLMDLDNTLYDFDGAYQAAVRQMAQELARHGVDADAILARQAELREAPAPAGAGSGRAVRMARMRKLLDSWPQTRALSEGPMVDQLERRLLASFQLLPGARAALEALRRRMTLLVVTEGWADIQHAAMRALGLPPEEWRAFATLSQGVNKADGSAYTLALQQLRARPEETIMVGDNWDWDVVAPARLGIRPIWIARQRPVPAGVPQGFLGAVADVGQLPAWLESRGWGGAPA